jgi:FkbM family methyltransferase
MHRVLRKSIALVPWRVRNAIRNVPLIAPLQRWVLQRFLEGQEFVHTVDAGPARGLNYPITLPQDKGVWTGTYELEVSTAVSEAVQPGDICLDIGGWRGFFGGVMALAGAKRVFIFEPLPANCTQIRKLIELNPELPLTLCEVAVGEEAGQAEFCVMPMSGMGKLASSPFQRDARSNSRIAVNVVSLDELLEEGKIELPSVIKIDVEGAETSVLRGAKQFLNRHRPKLFVEVHSRSLARECATILGGYGYRFHVMETGREPNLSTEPEVCHFIALPKNGEVIRPTPKQTEADRGIDVPILLYHHLVARGPVDPAFYEISVDQFEKQLDLLHRGHFETVTLERLFQIIEGDRPYPRRMAVITFDDAPRSFIQLALPALLARKMTASVFVPAAEIGGTNRWDTARGFPERAVMTENEIREIMDAGIEIGAHGWAHRDLTRCSDAELHEEIFDSRREMQRRLGLAPDFFAYPYGKGFSRLYPLLAEAGYRGAVSIFCNEPTVTANRFCMRRIYIHSGDSALRFRIKLSRAYQRYKAFRGAPLQSME